MSKITIDTTDPQYQQLLNGLATLRTVLAPRVKKLAELSLDDQKWMLRRDPLLRRTIRMAQTLTEVLGLDAEE